MTTDDTTRAVVGATLGAAARVAAGWGVQIDPQLLARAERWIVAQLTPPITITAESAEIQDTRPRPPRRPRR